jgi:hypothetical protein
VSAFLGQIEAQHKWIILEMCPGHNGSRMIGSHLATCGFQIGRSANPIHPLDSQI